MTDSFLSDVLSVLISSLQILKSEYVWSKVHHILFSASIRHLQQVVNVIQSWTKNITDNSNNNCNIEVYDFAQFSVNTISLRWDGS